MVSLLSARPLRHGTYRGTGSGHLHARAARRHRAGPRPALPGGLPLDRPTPRRSSWSRRAPVSRPSAEPSPTGVARGPASNSRPRSATSAATTPDADFLHAAELRAAEAAGAVSAAPGLQRTPRGRPTASSSTGSPPRPTRCGSCSSAGARVYVCGDGSRMAPGVRDAFRALHRRAHRRRRRGLPRQWLRRTDRGGALRRGRLRGGLRPSPPAGRSSGPPGHTVPLTGDLAPLSGGFDHPVQVLHPFRASRWPHWWSPSSVAGSSSRSDAPPRSRRASRSPHRGPNGARRAPPTPHIHTRRWRAPRRRAAPD